MIAEGGKYDGLPYGKNSTRAEFQDLVGRVLHVRNMAALRAADSQVWAEVSALLTIALYTTEGGSE